MTETLTDAAISFDLFCVPSCSASLYLINGVPNPLAGVAQYETDRSFSGAGNFAYTLAGRTLSAGVTYTLILSILDGNGLWRSTRTPQVTGTSVMIGDSWLMTSLDIGYPALSAFQPFSGVTAKFSIKGEAIRPPSAVPLPPGLPLLLVALGVLARRRAT